MPSLGFPYYPQIQFLHEANKIFPEANTCLIILRLPIHNNYDMFVKYMTEGILQAPWFGVVWTFCECSSSSTTLLFLTSSCCSTDNCYRKVPGIRSCKMNQFIETVVLNSVFCSLLCYAELLQWFVEFCCGYSRCTAGLWRLNVFECIFLFFITVSNVFYNVTKALKFWNFSCSILLRCCTDLQCVHALL